NQAGQMVAQCICSPWWLCLSVQDSTGSVTISPTKAISTRLEPTLNPEVLELEESSGHEVPAGSGAACPQGCDRLWLPGPEHWLVYTVTSEGLAGPRPLCHRSGPAPFRALPGRLQSLRLPTPCTGLLVS
uniref:Uncharacterized protein n=1 Tax=Catagonus wagneri TaxID=51154 RepID=A0A8C3WZR0_9CETA